ncbi:hypothetical protein [Haliangium sp. UPWRP_2]|uniref:hypothetical protein n=1 Tax=Haliangium sp. UPWRP_2 TaxID=1931276 RepID=UPI000B53A0CB|nr:hypothetical protein [Haliangium sp. UPWRP_2]PSM31211.1 hypothetical protein BVG81_006555 [Haliangium sp. UPWRP_2]
MSDEQALEFVLPRFDIRRQGRAWAGDEVRDRLRRLGECKIEVLDGQLFSDAFQRRMLLGMLLENVGLDAALELAESALWHQALAAKHSRQQPGRRL